MTFVIAVAPLITGLVYFWICAASGQSYPAAGYELWVGLPSLYCALAATPLAIICIIVVRDSWSRLAVVAVIADCCLTLPGWM